ncbi:hypothetical protein GGE45_000319 [Rhizobium aethiopicum]|uniref:Uncharacterized protein n=1 Tax=Rhizobium aethiopicum TaxID=1138170 RepID=A0A7W6MDP8_9HYPH|nr:hypothetical protein [Rhizobium aethiopicum]MBB4190836.1 hypothetical protein [Rhizobium aethiopicum]MBB4578025.1 hypothetical protein [Rhizobium aethiopicum]
MTIRRLASENHGKTKEMIRPTEFSAGSAEFFFHFVMNLRNLIKISRNLAMSPPRVKHGRRVR